MPFKNANSLFELSDLDIDLEIFLKKPGNAHLVKKEVQKVFIDEYVYTWADLNKSFFGFRFFGTQRIHVTGEVF